MGCSSVLHPRGSPGSGDMGWMQPQSQGLVSGKSAAPWGSTSYVFAGDRKGQKALSPSPKAVQPVCRCWLVHMHLWVYSSAIVFFFFFFQLRYAHCDNRGLNSEQHYETSEIDVSISWYLIPGMTCLLCPLTVLVEAYQNAGHMFSNSIAGIQLEKRVSLNYSHMLYIPLQHIISYHVPSAQNLTLHKTICFEFECIYFLTQNKTL